MEDGITFFKQKKIKYVAIHLELVYCALISECYQ